MRRAACKSKMSNALPLYFPSVLTSLCVCDMQLAVHYLTTEMLNVCDPPVRTLLERYQQRADVLIWKVPVLKEALLTNAVRVIASMQEGAGVTPPPEGPAGEVPPPTAAAQSAETNARAQRTEAARASAAERSAAAMPPPPPRTVLQPAVHGVSGEVPRSGTPPHPLAEMIPDGLTEHVPEAPVAVAYVLEAAAARVETEEVDGFAISASAHATVDGTHIPQACALTTRPRHTPSPSFSMASLTNSDARHHARPS